MTRWVLCVVKWVLPATDSVSSSSSHNVCSLFAQLTANTGCSAVSILGVGGLDTPWKYVGGTRVCFDPLKMSHSFIQNCWWITAIFTLSRNKDLCEKLLEAPTGCQEPGLLSVWKSLTWGVIWNSLTAVSWVTLTPCYTTDLHHCRRSMHVQHSVSYHHWWCVLSINHYWLISWHSVSYHHWWCDLSINHWLISWLCFHVPWSGDCLAVASSFEV